jgi:hypothetical protein
MEIGDADPSVCVERQPNCAERVGQVLADGCCCDWHCCSSEYVTSARFASFAWEAEQDYIESCCGSGKDSVALHFVFEPTPVLGSEVELEDELEGPAGILDPTEPVRTDVLLPPSRAPRLSAPFDDSDDPVCRSCDVVHAGEEAVDGTRVPKPGVVHEGAFPVLAVADRLDLDPKMFSHDLRDAPGSGVHLLSSSGTCPSRPKVALPAPLHRRRCGSTGADPSSAARPRSRDPRTGLWLHLASARSPRRAW